MSNSLNVIALISGGKDSFFSLLHCLHHNHHIIALANLYPPPPAPTSSSNNPPSDLNSYMYQTVGHTLIPLYATALGLPLYRRAIAGSAINSQKAYHPSAADDETESLLHLLREIKHAHPSVNAVSCGAILSSYQRTRVESVAARLGLTPLAFLWQYPALPTPVPRPAGLLEDIAAVGLDARVVKVASGGLGEGMLWGSLRDERVRWKLARDVARFGGSVLGEGGEFETMVISGPRPLWRCSLEVGEAARRVVSAQGGEAWIAFEEGGVRVFTDEQMDCDWEHRLKIPGLWDSEFATLVGGHHATTVCSAEGREEREDYAVKMPFECGMQRSVITRSKSTLTISNLSSHDFAASADEQMSVVSEEIRQILQDHERSPDDIVFTTILLRSMQDFAAVNNVYSKLFAKPNPPARVTIACGDTLPQGIEIMLSITVDLGPQEARQGLHVQSRSYWAPANIGPYSQAISVPMSHDMESSREQASLVYVAGQIPLVSASMTLLQVPEQGNQDPPGAALAAFWEQTCLSLQHLWRIGRATDVTWWTYGIAFIAGHDHVETKAKLASLAWEKVHDRSLWEQDGEEDADGPDAWDKKYGGQGSFATEVKEHRLPDFEALTVESDRTPQVPPFYAIQVAELPQNCSVEWQGLGASASSISLLTMVEDGTDRQRCTLGDRNWTISAYSISASASDEKLENILSQLSGRAAGKTCFLIYTARTWLIGTFKAQIMPCRSIWGKGGCELAAVVLVQRESS